MINDVKESYSNNDWHTREDYYKQACGQIILNPNPTTKDVMSLTAYIDNILSEALLELSYVKRNYLMYKTKMTLSEKEAFLICKQNSLATEPTKKITENDVKGLVVQYLKNNHYENTNLSIYDIVQLYEYRLTFIESVVKILTEKKAGIITDNAMLKIESNLSQDNINN